MYEEDVHTACMEVCTQFSFFHVPFYVLQRLQLKGEWNIVHPGIQIKTFSIDFSHNASESVSGNQ